MSVAAVTLAAGASTRMGRPKALLEWRGRPFFSHCVQGAERVGCVPSVVVWGAVALPTEAVEAVHNPRWKAGPLSSLQVGVRAVLPSAPTGVLVLTVDRPHLRETTLAALLAAHAQSPTAVVQPSSGGRRGHPILLPRCRLDEVLSLTEGQTLRDVVRSVGVRRVSIPSDDPAIFDNLDTPADLHRLPM